MTQLRDDCFAFGGKLMTAGEALNILAERVSTTVETESVTLDAAAGRILAEPMAATFDQPPHDNAAVDGYALRHQDLNKDRETRLHIIGRAAAGHPFAGKVAPGHAARIFTGAVMPTGTDTVVMQEDVTLEDEAVQIPSGLRKGANRRRAGEDVGRGETVLEAGQRLRPQEIAMAAAIGADHLRVFQPLRVAVFSTGDELVEPGAALAPGAVYDANRHLLMALTRGLNCVVNDLGILPDKADVVRRSLQAAAANHDLLLTSGGISTGEEDHVRAAVEADGSLHFWRLAIKPGRPLALGQVGATPFIGLPGNPATAAFLITPSTCSR